MRLTALLVMALAVGCGTSGPTVEEITRENILRTRAQAIARHVGPCVAACDQAVAALDAGGTIHDLGWHEKIVAIHSACDGPLGRR